MNSFQRILTLSKMQLQEKIDLNFLKDKKKALFKIVFALIIFIVITVVISTLFRVILTLLLSFTVDSTMLAFFLLIMQVVSLISCTSGLIKTLYLSNDNVLLLSFPTRPNEVFVSKLLVFYIYELKRNLNFFLPFFVAFGLYSKLGIFYYVFTLFLYFLLPLLPVLLGAFLSIPLMLIKSFLKERPLFLTLIFFVFAAGIIYATFWLGELIPNPLVIVAIFSSIYKGTLGFIRMVVENTVLFKMIVDITLFSNFFQNLGIFLGLLLSLMLLNIFTARPLFFRIASRPFEFGKSSKKRKNNKSFDKPYLSFLKKEFLTIFRTPDALMNNFSYLLALPVILYLLNKVLASIPTVTLGKSMEISFTLMMLLVVVLVSNSFSANAFSREGRAFYYSKTAPMSYQSQAWAKLTINIVLSSIAITLSVAILSWVVSFEKINLLYISITALFMSAGHTLWSAELDVMNPQVQAYSTSEHHIDNPNIGKSILIGIILAMLLSGFCLKLFTESPSTTFIRIIAIAVVFFGLRLYLFINRLNVYFREIEI